MKASKETKCTTRRRDMIWKWYSIIHCHVRTVNITFETHLTRFVHNMDTYVTQVIIRLKTGKRRLQSCKNENRKLAPVSQPSPTEVDKEQPTIYCSWTSGHGPNSTVTRKRKEKNVFVCHRCISTADKYKKTRHQAPGCKQ